MASTKTHFTGPGTPSQPFDRGKAATWSTLAGKLVVVLMALVGAIFFVGVLVVIATAFLVAVLAAVCVVGIREAWHALVPRSRDHHVDGGGFGPRAVIETTAKAIRSAAPKPRP
jgi:hypothetical protein